MSISGVSSHGKMWYVLKTSVYNIEVKSRRMLNALLYNHSTENTMIALLQKCKIDHVSKETKSSSRYCTVASLGKPKFIDQSGGVSRPKSRPQAPWWPRLPYIYSKIKGRKAGDPGARGEVTCSLKRLNRVLESKLGSNFCCRINQIIVLSSVEEFCALNLYSQNLATF